MKLIKQPFFETPWHLIRFFIPFAALVPAVVYYLTVFKHVYPGTPAFLTASAAGLCPQNDLAHPFFTLAIRAVAEFPFATLPVRLNLFCAACGALTVSLFYLFTARLIFFCACEDSGGAMAAMPPRLWATDDDDPDDRQQGFARNADGSVSIPVSVQTHNWRVTRAAVLGGLCGALVLAFCAPFWLASTRLYPFTFELALFFIIINLLFSYDQSARLSSLFLGAFLLTACSVESLLFLLLLPIGGAFLLRSLILNEQATLYKTLFVVLLGLTGAVLACVVLWQASTWCAAIPTPAVRPILREFQDTVLREISSCIPSYGWSYIFMQLLFPSAIAFFVFSFSFHKRTPILFLLQLVMTAALVPSLLNLRVSPWAIARATSKIPVFSYTLVALWVGLMIAVWYLMREISEEEISEDFDYYEYRDNPVVCRIGAILCWFLVLLVGLVPFRSFTDIDPRNGTFVDEVTERIYRELGSRDWIVNSRLLSHYLMIRAFQDGRHFHFINTKDAPDPHDISRLAAYIKEYPSLEPYRFRLLNAADISPDSFLFEWLKCDTNAYQRIALFDVSRSRFDNGFQVIPDTVFSVFLPKAAPVDVSALQARYLAFVETMRPYLFPVTPVSRQIVVDLQARLRRQIAFVGNKLGVLLAAQKRPEEAAQLFDQAGVLSPDNLCVLLNRFNLATRLNVHPEALPELQARLHTIPQRFPNTHLLTAASLQADNGSLIDPDILEYVRKDYWFQSHAFKKMAFALHTRSSELITILRDRKRDLCQTITQLIDAYEFDTADIQLNLLLDLDDKDRFALINKARVAIERQDLPEAGLWLDLAKENGVKPAELIWHNAAILILGGKLAEARVMLNEAIPAAASDIRLWGLLADILLRLDEYPELETRVFPALCSAARKKEHYLVYMVRGYILKHNGPEDYREARAAFLRALDLNKNLNPVREEVLRLDDALGVPAFSEEDAKAILRRNPDHTFANFLLGMVRLDRSELDLAEDLFRRSLETERNAPAYAGLGAVLLEKKILDSAEKFLRRSLELDNSRLFAWHTLARLLLATDRLDEAARALAPVVADQPNDPAVRLTLIRLTIKQKKIEAAIELFAGLLEEKDLLPERVARQLELLTTQLSNALPK